MISDVGRSQVTSHSMSWAPGHTGHSRGGGLPPAWGLPPGVPAPRHAPGHPVRHQHDRDAAARKRKEEAQAARLERQRQAGLLENENLFKPPSRMVGQKFILYLIMSLYFTG